MLRYFQYFYHPNSEQGCMAKMSQEMQKTILDPVPAHASTRESATMLHWCISKSCPVLLDVKLIFPSGREVAAIPPTRGWPPLLLWARPYKNEDPPAQGSQHGSRAGMAPHLGKVGGK